MSTKIPGDSPIDPAGTPPVSPTEEVHAEIAAVVKPEIPDQFRELALALGDGTALAEQLRTGGESAFLEAVDTFTRGMKYPPAREWSCNTTESLIHAVFTLRAHTGEPYTELIDALAGAYVAQDGGWRSPWSNWSHSLCHLFEQYNRGESFLDRASDLPAAEKLFLENARRAVEEGELSCTDRTTGAMVRYNLDHLDASNLDGAFPFRPTPQEPEEFAALFDEDDECGRGERLFFTAATPREFLVSMVRKQKWLSGYPARQVELLALIEESVTPEELAAYLAKHGRVNGEVLSLAELRAGVASAAAATEMLPGTYVDVDGTLIVDGALNERVAKHMVKRAQEGEAFTVVTGGDPDAQTELLRELGLPGKFLPVVSKSTLRGKIVERLIDDSPPAYQGFRAVEHSTPNYIW